MSMASSSLPNFLSFFKTTKSPSPPPPTRPPRSQLSLSSDTKEISSGLNPQTLSLSTSSNSDVMSVVCPSFAYANTMYCKPYNVQIEAEEEEDGQSLVQRFRREVMRAGIIQEVRRRQFHETKQEKVKRKHQEAAKKNRRRKGPYVPYRPPGSELEMPEVEDEPDDDYWDGYDEPLPADQDIEESL